MSEDNVRTARLPHDDGGNVDVTFHDDGVIDLDSDTKTFVIRVEDSSGEGTVASGTTVRLKAGDPDHPAEVNVDGEGWVRLSPPRYLQEADIIYLCTRQGRDEYNNVIPF